MSYSACTVLGPAHCSFTPSGLSTAHHPCCVGQSTALGFSYLFFTSHGLALALVLGRRWQQVNLSKGTLQGPGSW